MEIGGAFRVSSPLSRFATASPEGEHLGASDPHPLGEVARRAGGACGAQQKRPRIAPGPFPISCEFYASYEA
ncbi:hypothetical protein CFHF_07950 [Caulobacter flavus]|uniref:Uncharacterized protein n=1 Tax=Caulobacter flavus TaxID=1679497 RepID=A0A2N5CVB5_9CAUL|nr:hypothetical protein C1707_11535 [Caulobacter flavus]PLR17751.1 hypothetical protein CFHF_07950 [Caulobacter flavus]